MTFCRKNILIYTRKTFTTYSISHMTKNPNSIESAESKSNSSKFIESTKRAVWKVLATTWIFTGSLGPVATQTVIPASVNTITTITPIASTAIKTIWLWTAAGLFVACGGSEDGPDWPIDTKDTIAPTIKINKSEMDITWWKQIQIIWNQLYIWGEAIAYRSDNKTTNCNVSLSLNWKSITSWTTVCEEGTLPIKVSDTAWNSKNADIKLTLKQDISWLENLKNLNMQVDQEVNLLNWITFNNWAELIKTEIELDWEKVEISDPNHYVPPYPWTCSIILLVKDKNWEIKEYKIDNLTIKALEYKEVTINTANMINEKYHWYNNLKQPNKDFIYPHLLSSYAACNWSNQDNRIHIIMGETANTDDLENIWQHTNWDDHGYEWYYRIRALCPNTPIKWCDDTRENLENYINQHPNNIFLISCAADTWWWSNWEEMNNNPDTPTQRRMLEKKNVIFIEAGGNRVPATRKIWNENIKDWTRYKSCSINSRLNNKITVTWYESWWSNNYFSPSAEYWWLDSAMPVWFEKNKWNIVMPMIQLISPNNREYISSTSSFPTAVTSGIIWNAISIIMTNRNWITAEDAMTIICNNYLREETFQYKDETTNWKLADWWKRYFIEMQQLLNNELLQSKKIENLQLNSEDIALPNSKWICYTGIWIQFEFEWKRYVTTDTNQSILNQALKSWNIKWYWNKNIFKKHGWKDNSKFNVYIVDKDGNKIPDLNLNINKPIN